MTRQHRVLVMETRGLVSVLGLPVDIAAPWWSSSSPAAQSQVPVDVGNQLAGWSGSSSMPKLCRLVHVQTQRGFYLVQSLKVTFVRFKLRFKTRGSKILCWNSSVRSAFGAAELE